MKIPIIKENETRDEFIKRGVEEMTNQNIDSNLSNTLLRAIWVGNDKLKNAIIEKITSKDILK
jgi:hypothetical protein